MKKVLLLVGLLLLGNICLADYVNGYRRSNGTYVAPHYRSSADSSRYNNYSTRGNYNPYTGAKGYTNPQPYRLPTNNTYRPYKSKMLNY